MAAIVAAAVVNLVGNTAVEGSASTTAVLKILGIAVLAIAGLIGAAVSGKGFFSETSGESFDLIGLLAGTTLCVLAYGGFTTHTNQGDDIQNPKKNIARSIVFSLPTCTVLYLLITASVQSSIGTTGAVEARDYALARAAEPPSRCSAVGMRYRVRVLGPSGRVVLHDRGIVDDERDAEARRRGDDAAAVGAIRIDHQPCRQCDSGPGGELCTDVHVVSQVIRDLDAIANRCQIAGTIDALTVDADV